jgi:hypothetical protein
VVGLLLQAGTAPLFGSERGLPLFQLCLQRRSLFACRGEGSL